MNERLGLGTVQIGLPYGVANRSGQVDPEEARAILTYAESMGLDLLDTAVAYGESERRLGRIGVNNWRVVSKLPPVPQECRNISAWIDESVSESLERLRITSLYGLLLHDPQQLLREHGEAFFRDLAALKDRNKVEKIGVSIYGPDELEALIPRFELNLVQAPFNVIDRRLATSGWLDKLHEAEIEVHVRSVFLQGLLLMGPERRPAQFRAWHPIWGEWHAWLDEQELSPLQACLRFVMSHAEIDKVIVGVESATQLQEIIENAGGTAVAAPQTIISEDLDLIDPSRWTQS
jgi:aryl-alcohol dehydrogenase-like predicted oxidoreductase